MSAKAMQMKVLWRGIDRKIAFLEKSVIELHAEVEELATINDEGKRSSWFVFLVWRMHYLEVDLRNRWCAVHALGSIQRKYKSGSLFFRIRYAHVRVAPVDEWSWRLDTAWQLFLSASRVLAPLSPESDHVPEAVAG